MTSEKKWLEQGKAFLDTLMKEITRPARHGTEAVFRGRRFRFNAIENRWVEISNGF